MKVIRILIIISQLIIIALIVNACGDAKINGNRNDSKKQDNNVDVNIAIISKSWQHQFWQSVKMGANKAANDYNVKITFQGPETDAAVSKQLEMIDSAINQKPAAIILAACDPKAVIPKLEKAKSENIPVITFDSGVDSDIPLTTVATDNLVAAGAAADKLAQAIGGEGEVAILCHSDVGVTGVQRRDGFINRIKEKYPKIRVVDIKYGGGDHTVSEDLTDEIIDNHPNIKGIFATNEGSAIGLINGMVEKNKIGKIATIGFDAGKQQKDAVREGMMIGAVAQDPVEIGYKAVEAAYKAYKGESLDKFIDTGYKWYDKTNVDSEELKDLLYD